MSQLKVDEIVDASGGSNAVLYGPASPAGSMGFRNRIINGDMRIAQRGTAAVTGNPSYVVDRFLTTNSTSAGAYSAQQDSSAPAGFTKSIKVTTTTADASLATTEQVTLRHYIEGLNMADLGWGTANAKTVTISFWVRSSLTGTFGGSLANGNADYAYPFSYSISAADTWEQKSVTITGPTGGTWASDNSLGIRVNFGLGVGPDFSGTAGSWAASYYTSVTGAVSVIGTLNATWYITGVQLEVGSVATEFERRPYGTELALCQRYYYNIYGTDSDFQIFGAGVWTSSTNGRILIDVPVPFRSVPTLEAASLRLFDAAGATTRSATGFSVTGTVVATNKASINITVSSSSATTGQSCLGVLNTSTSARIGFSAEL